MSKLAAKSVTSTAARPVRSGADYLASIKDDGRHVYYDGELVRDVTSHAAFKGAARSLARLFDVAADPANAETMTFASPKTGAPVWRCYQIPKTAADLASRRRRGSELVWKSTPDSFSAPSVLAWWLEFAWRRIVGEIQEGKLAT